MTIEETITSTTTGVMDGLAECDGIKDRYEKDECYSDVGISMNDSSICDKIQDPDQKDWCYLKVGALNISLSRADRYYFMAITYYLAEDFNRSITFVEKAKEIYRELNHSEGVSKCDKLRDKFCC